MVTSLGLEVEENWSNALAGISGIQKLSYPETEHSRIQAAGTVKSDDWKKLCQELDPASNKADERRTKFALWAAQKAYSDAALNSGTKERAGVILAAGLGINRLEDIHHWLTDDQKFDYQKFINEYKMVHPESIIKNNSHRPAALIADRFGLMGYNATITTACASATQAFGTAYRAIRRGDADIMLAGGADSMINPVGLIFFVLLGAASQSDGDPASACRPFDRKRSGLVMGEGAGIAVLEEEEHAKKRGAKIYAEVCGYATTMDAYKVTAPDPKGRGAELSMKKALDNAAMDPENIDYINAHGTSTKLNDSAETMAIKNVFGPHAQKLAINSSKSLTGHLIAASGGPEFIFTALSVNRDEIHPTINLTNPDPKCDLDYVANTKRQKQVRAAISNSFGFGGQNASIVIKKYIGHAGA
ncbi:MAG: beta-ketoacyl-[acyl-carrier-protein] synthase family protein [Nitrospira sp.]|nr:beta-ketoacyl-[acyl-carrier-protein] synthase family protein [bacterium]MBL7048977.1 beta-ketoacyl-[acyl-carrier-protein] synthase family protein [Nitrospira sp.]